MSDGPSVTEMGLDQESVAQPLNQNPENPPENPRPRSEILSERLDKLTEEDPDKYSPESRSNVKELLNQIKINESNPSKRVFWKRILHNFEEYKLFFELNQEWQGLSTGEIRTYEWGHSFYNASNNFIARHRAQAFKEQPELRDQIISERINMRRELFPDKRREDNAFKSLDDWKEEMQRLGFTGMNTGSIRKHYGGNNFYSLFNNFINRYRADELEKLPENPDDDTEKQAELRMEITAQRVDMRHELFPPENNDWSSFTFEDYKIYMEDNGYNGLSTHILQTKIDGGNSFYQAFNNFINRYRADELEKLPENPDDDTEKQAELRDEIIAQRIKMRHELFPPKQKDWSIFTTLEDWRDEMDSLGYTGLNVGQIQKYDGGENFYRKFNAFINKYRVQDYKEHPDLRDEIIAQRLKIKHELFPPQQHDWSHLVSLEAFREEWKKHPKWHGLRPHEIGNKEVGGKMFYRLLREYCDNYIDPDTGKPDPDDSTRIFEEFFPSIKPKYVFDGKEIGFDSGEERIAAMLLHKYGLLDKPLDKLPYGVAEESVDHKINIHFGINDDRRNSFDFLTDSGNMIEYHPLHFGEKRKGLDESNVLDERIGHVTREEYAGKPVYHIWELGQLYDIIIDPELNPNLDPENTPTEEEFKEAVKEAKEQARQYDLEREKEKQSEEDQEKERQVREELKQAA